LSIRDNAEEGVTDPAKTALQTNNREKQHPSSLGYGPRPH